MKRAQCVAMAAALWLFGAGAAAWSVEAEDVDGRRCRLDEPGIVTVVIVANAGSAGATRACGEALDEFQGRPDFRQIVLIDLRGSLGSWAQGMTRRRVQNDLDREAARIGPAFRKNAARGEPREVLRAILDPDGQISEGLGWRGRGRTVRAIVYDQKGREFARFDEVVSAEAVRLRVLELLGKRR